ncbi:MAG: hypothetical protein JWP12_1792 [Bacteroidetes bacterium]|nr:hypothetical protein [Bacteroidota bacterium]
MKNIKFTLSIFLIACLFALQPAKAQQWGNYTLYSVQNSTNTYLIDTNSVVYHTWTHTSANKTGYSSYLLPGGNLIRTITLSGTTFTGGGITGKVQKVDWNGNILWDYTYSTSAYCMHHDICPLPNGNVLLIAYESKTAAQVTAAGCSSSIVMWPDKIVEVQPTGTTTGTIVWEWHAWDHLVQNVSATGANYQTSIVNHPELLNINFNPQKEWMHMNGIDYNPMLDQITFSCHNLSEMFVIDHSTTTAEAASHSGGNSGKGGDILYRWGHPAVYSATGTQILNVVHDAHWVPEGSPNAGYLVGFNNQGISSSASCIDQFLPPYNGYNYSLTLGSAYTPSTYGLRQAVGGYSSNMGNSIQLPNGNMLVCIATSGIIKEFGPTGTLLWSKTATGAVPQAQRYDSCYVANAAPAIPLISESSGTLTATAATTYQWYMNGYQISGETNQTYTPTQSGIYIVRITDTNGCVYEYSTGYHYTLTTTGISEAAKNSLITIFPNPSTGVFNFDDAAIRNGNYEVRVYDAVGKLIISQKDQNGIDLSNYTNGIYFINITSPLIGSINKKVSLLK